MTDTTFQDELDKILTKLENAVEQSTLRRVANRQDVSNRAIHANAILAILTAAEAMGKREITGDTSDGYHTFNELYEYRMQYNSALFNEWALQGKYDVHKSWKHSDGEDCFGGGWFIVMAELPTGQISNHYPEKDWEQFNIPEKAKANEYDGHSPQEALERLARLSQELGKED